MALQGISGAAPGYGSGLTLEHRNCPWISGGSTWRRSGGVPKNFQGRPLELFRGCPLYTLESQDQIRQHERLFLLRTATIGSLFLSRAATARSTLALSGSRLRCRSMLLAFVSDCCSHTREKGRRLGRTARSRYCWHDVAVGVAIANASAAHAYAASLQSVRSVRRSQKLLHSACTKRTHACDCMPHGVQAASMARCLHPFLLHPCPFTFTSDGDR